ncbi:MAG: sulfotransferase domain-containing protein [Cyclobacteriaceae bacterium]
MKVDKLKYKLKKSFLRDVPARNHLTVYEDDIFIASYPRSGNTWLRFLIGTLYSDQTVTWENMESIVPDIYRCSDKFLREIKRPRILKSHHPFDARYKKVIYIVRDPRDVLVSFYYFQIKFGNEQDNQNNFNLFFENYVNGKIGDYGSWKTNIESWKTNKEKVNNGLIFLRYEDILRDTKHSLNEIADFLEIKKSPERIDEVISLSSFANMKKLENEQSDTASIFKKSNNELNFVRQGEVGVWKDLLSKRQLEILYLKFGGLMKEFGYEIK